ncbi:MAG: tRNA (cytidine(34)-2'-O)-methyltransferase [Gammaproteobacteria bacterium]
MFHLVLFEPEIPPNTGNIIRLCANTGCRLHLVRPLGFAWDDRRLRRAGLDYHEWASVQLHDDFDACRRALDGVRMFAFSAHAQCTLAEAVFAPGDALLFGPETRGLPATVLDRIAPERRLRIPMRDGSRSMNLSNAAAVAVYEAWRQQGYAGAAAGKD